jgi:2-polyprenyl-3-methyl-5-hydroxy-6-metoxy-1,4-benzoquinol methylase
MKADSKQSDSGNSGNCSICGSIGVDVYRGLKDRLFGTPGEWRITQCSNEACALGWLSPGVTKDSLASLYVDYYTHKEDASEFAALPEQSTYTEKFLGGLRIISGFENAKKEAGLMYLSDLKAGRVLDIGCGSGMRLSLFGELGWSAEGQDVDVAAVENARVSTGLPVHLGEIETLELEPGGYDAVVMNHVLEHVLDPAVFLSQCKQLVRPGGKLVVAVPNFSGSGRAIFGPDWRGLEPPRHLFHFSPRNLRKLASLAGLYDAKVFSSVANAEVFALSSYMLRQGIPATKPQSLGKTARVLSLLWQYISVLESWVRPERGDECVMIWTAPETDD